MFLRGDHGKDSSQITKAAAAARLSESTIIIKSTVLYLHFCRVLTVSLL